MELKPCPFCGGEAETTFMPYGTSYINKGASFIISCTKCGTSKSVRLEPEEGKLSQNLTFNDVFISINQCEEKWNRRAENVEE